MRKGYWSIRVCVLAGDIVSMSVYKQIIIKVQLATWLRRDESDTGAATQSVSENEWSWVLERESVCFCGLSF